MSPTSTTRRRFSVGAALLGAAALTAVLAAPPASADTTAPPLQVVDGLIDTTDTNALGLPQAENAETVTIFSPGDEDLKFNHGVVLMPFKGRLYAQWQSSALDEDAADTVVRYAVSDESGESWSEPIDLTAPRTDGYTSNGGWWTDGETLVAYLNVWPSALKPRGGYVLYRSTTDGVNWSDAQPITDSNGEPVRGIIEQDTKALPSGRILTAVHVQPGLQVKPYYTDDPQGITGWTQGEFDDQPYLPDEMSRELEPSWYVQQNGDIVMTFRDQGGSSMHKLASVSSDNGETWSPSVVTNVPDSRTKQSAGNLPDGTAYLAGSLTGTKTRFPLVIVLSADGETFTDGFTLRDAADLQPLRYAGKSKNLGYSYQKSIVWGDYLYVSYGTNKEDAQYTRVPLDDISLRTAPGTTAQPSADGAGRSLGVSWTAPEGVAPTGYVITATSKSGQSSTLEVGADATAATLTGVAPGRYSVTVTAFNAFAAGEASEPSPWTTVTGRTD
ncbi:exo-alpha-sialidase [Microbacterium jejuense]|uniref:exo-alpha-sialidase n=1 Tax=Microbacterium jejuense TaxID=1263637 RepID=UPI0031EA4C38